MSVFTIGGFVIGPALPADSVQLGDAEIRKVRPGESYPRGRPRFPRLEFTEDGTDEVVDHFSVTPGEIFVRSSWIVRFRVEADNEDQALEEVDVRRLPPLLAALEAVGREPYRVELVRVIDEDRETEMSPWTDPALGRPYAPLPLSPTAEDLLRLGCAIAASDPVAREAAELLRDSVLLHDLGANHVRLLRAAVLALFQAIERVARATVSSMPAEIDTDRQRTVVEHLRRALSKGRGPEADVRSIRKAASEIDRISGSTTDEQIQRAGAVLGVDPEAIKSARALLRFRNQRLGHAGRPVSARELLSWLAPERGRGAALQFWARYVDRIAAERTGSGRAQPRPGPPPPVWTSVASSLSAGIAR